MNIVNNQINISEKIKLIKKIKVVYIDNHIHNSEDIFIKNYYHTNEQLVIDNFELEEIFLKLKRQEKYTLFDAENIFEIINSTGKIFFEYYILNIDNISLHDLIDNNFSANIKDIKDFYKNWIYIYGYPYNCYTMNSSYKGIYDDLYIFFKHSIYLYILFEIHKYIVKSLSIINEKIKEYKKAKENDKQYYNYNTITIVKKNSSFYKFLNLIKDDLNLKINVPNMPKEINGEIIKEKVLKYFENMEKYFNDLKILVTKYIYEVINDQPIANFYVTKQRPIYDNKEKTFNLYYSASSFMGVAYNQLLLHTVSNKYFLIKRRICANPDCNIDFEKFGKIKYCETCIKNGIPNKLKQQKYEDSIKGKEARKQYHEEYRKKGKKKSKKKEEK